MQAWFLYESNFRDHLFDLVFWASITRRSNYRVIITADLDADTRRVDAVRQLQSILDSFRGIVAPYPMNDLNYWEVASYFIQYYGLGDTIHPTDLGIALT